MTFENIASVAHAANMAFRKTIGEELGPAWDECEQSLRDSAIQGVSQIYYNPETTPEKSHEGWLAFKESDGWKYGPVKDIEKKLHPCMVPYDQLPGEQQVKDDLFGAIVKALAPFVTTAT